MAEISTSSWLALLRIRASLQNCRLGNHDLVDIASDSHGGGESTEVRWCKNCGSIVVDGECDGRVQPGGVQPMKGPEVSKLAQNL